MAFTEISSQRASSAASGAAASRSVAYPGNVTAGDLLVVAGSFETSGALTRPFLSATGAGAPVASSWVVIPSWLQQNVCGTYVAFAVAGASGACTVVVSYIQASGLAGSAYGTYSIGEFSGVGGAVGLLQAIGSSTAPAPGTMAVADTDLMLGVTTWRSSATPTVPTGWTQIGTQNGFGADITHNFAFKVATATGSESPAWALSGSTGWVAQAVRLSLIGGGGGGGGSTGGSYTFIG